MREKTLSIPERIATAGPRIALGIGVGLLLSRKIRRDSRGSAGGALLAVNAVNTVRVINTVKVINTVPIVSNIARKPDSRLENPAA